ncbi:MAG TPA: hypothetical protein VGE97_09270 [Nitrososphaera sp.]|jgi:phage gpG-like protein
MELVSTYQSFNVPASFIGSIEFRWGPHEDEPMIVGAMFDYMSQGLTEIELPLLVSKEIMIEDVRDRFNRQVDVDEVPWQNLSKKYGTWKQFHAPGQKIMQLTVDSPRVTRNNELLNALTSRSTYQIFGNQLFVDTDQLPVYWRVHDRGGTVGRGATMPQRSFLGMSEKAKIATVDVFDDWVDRNLQIVRPGKSGIPMFRGAFGRIGGPAATMSHIPRKAPVFQTENIASLMSRNRGLVG